MKKIIALILSALFLLTFAGCNNGNSSSQDPDILAVYDMYSSYTEQKGGTPLSYEDWLSTIKGEKGDPGVTPTIEISNDGYWVINGKKTEYKAEGSSSSSSSNTINVFLPDEYDIAVNDNFQLFYRGVVQAVNPYNYDVTVTCEKGKAYPRYFEWTPAAADVGKSYTLKMTIRDDNGNLLGSDSTKLTVHKPKTTGVETQNVLCFGDSLTQRGYWTSEVYRRFTQTGGSPAGLGANYLNFIGTDSKMVNGNRVGYEGKSGRHWEWFCGTDSPFYDSSLHDISFKSYCQKNGYEDIDIVYILLTWNRQGTPYNTFDITKGQFVYATKIIDKLHQEYPNAIIRCMGIQMPSQCGGMGYMYGANGSYSEDYGMLVSAMRYNAALEDFCQQAKYKSFVKYVDVAGQFDTDYNMPASDKPVNNRSQTKEKIGTDGVHPSVAGFYQIADAAYRSLCEVFGE